MKHFPARSGVASVRARGHLVELWAGQPGHRGVALLNGPALLDTDSATQLRDWLIEHLIQHIDKPEPPLELGTPEHPIKVPRGTTVINPSGWDGKSPEPGRNTQAPTDEQVEHGAQALADEYYGIGWGNAGEHRENLRSEARVVLEAALGQPEPPVNPADWGLTTEEIPRRA